MRSGRGKCPQCKETIVVDLDAAEIRCPLCNALLKKSKKTVAEVRAEEEARIAAAEARERALRGEPEAPAEPVVETPAEEVAEAPAEAPVDEIGMTDEELAALDDVLPTDAEESTAVEPSAEAVDEIGLSDEELAAMDDVLPTDTEGAADAAPTEEASDADIDIPVADEPIEVAPADDADDDIAVTGSVSDEEDIAEADVAPAEDEEGDTSDEDTAGSLGSTYVISDEAADEAPQVEIEDEPTEGAASPAPTEDASDADIDIPLADESAEETPIEEAAVEEAAVAESPDIEISESEESLAEETPVEEEVPAEETPAEEVPAEEETPGEEVEVEEEIPVEEVEEEIADAEPAAYTDEDMAFAASLSDGIAANDSGEKEGKKVGYVAPVNTAKPAKDRGNKADARAKKGDAPKGERNMSDSAIYKKPVAVIMMILAFIGAAVSLLLTTNVAVFAFISDSVGEKVIELVAELPEFLFDYAAAIFGGVVVLISILGLTGKRGKLGFLFALLAGLIYTANALFGGVAPVIEVEAIAKILADYGEYVGYAVYGLLLLAAIFFAVSINGGKEELEISGGTAALPIIYMLVAVVGTIALVILPRIMESFTMTTDILKYAILGIVGLSILLTLIGVHSKTASRGANAWLLFAAAMIVALIFGVITLVTKLIPEEKALDVLPAAEIFLCVSPCILFFPLIGYTISDLRN